MSSLKKIEILKEIQKELEIRKSWKPFYVEGHLEIGFDVANSILYANWNRSQSETRVMEGCEKILEGLNQFRCNKILNNTLSVKGIWTPAARWVAEDWFPRLVISGLNKLAWICSPSVLRQHSTKEALRLTRPSVRIKVFKDQLSALEWLATTR